MARSSPYRGGRVMTGFITNAHRLPEMDEKRKERFPRRQGGPAMRPEVTLIKKSGPNPVISKRIYLGDQGKVCSDGSQCLMAQGTATRAAAETAAVLAEHIMACGTDQAIALGALRTDLPNPVQITTSARLKDNPGAITRSREFINYRSGAPAWALLDFDTKGMPANVAASIEAAGGMWNALLIVASGLLEQNIEVRKAVPVAITETKERSAREGAV
jgi:hypothetical protein